MSATELIRAQANDSRGSAARFPASSPLVLRVAFRSVVARLGLGMAFLAGAVWAADPAPSPEDQERFLAAARQHVIDYAKSLPDFVCTERIQRYSGRARSDTLTVDLGYYQGKEQYSLNTINGHRPYYSDDSITGLGSFGEFGGVLKLVVGTKAATAFQFGRWTSIRGRPAAVYSYRLALADSDFALVYGSPGATVREIVGLTGEVALDRETQTVFRLAYMAEGIPAGYPVKSFSAEIWYDYAEVGGRQYLLPSRARAEMRALSAQSECGTGGYPYTGCALETRAPFTAQPTWAGPVQRLRSVVDFHSYRKFSSDSTVHFGEAPPKQ